MGAAAAKDSLIGEIIANRYQIECKLGEGAMGAVYRARHVKVGREFAVKILHERLLLDRKTAERFEREAELAGRLRHPNVIGVVDVGETQGTRYMVMDFAEGLDLANLLNEAPFTPERIINLVRQLCDGLYHAHEQGLIHRDFKPENVIVEKDNHGREVPRIVDFGIAILAEAGESPDMPGRLTTNGLVLGTPHYMAPEQAVADPIDHRIDLFALGIMVYEMLSGRLPFDGSGAEVARANLMLDPPLISQRVPFLEVDPLLEAFARRLMAKQRDMRPPTGKAARELLDLIERDREAAAAQLGVPLEEATRPPMITADSSPIRPDPITEPPPFREVLETPPQAPPMEAPVAIEAPPPPELIAPRIPQRGLDTELTRPLDYGPKKSRTPLFGALAAVVVLTGIVVVVLARGGGDKPTDSPVKTPVTDPQPVAKADPPPEQAKTEPAKTEPESIEMDPVAVEKPKHDDPPKPPKHDDPPKHVDPPKHDEPTHTVAKVDPPKKDPVKTDPPKTDPTKPLTQGDIDQLWAAVGSEVIHNNSVHQDDASKALLAEYKNMPIQSTYNQTDEFRAKFVAHLVRLRREVIQQNQKK